jgi:hypothetical protein
MGALNSRADAEESPERDRERLCALISRDETTSKDATAVHAAFFIEAMNSKANILVMGRACFLRVPVSEANDLNFLLCRYTETGYASRLGNNETKPMK